MGTDGDDQLARVFAEGIDRSRNDSSDRPAPARVHGRDAPGRPMPDQDRHAVGRAYRHTDASRPSDQRVSLVVGDRLRGVVAANLGHAFSVDLSLLKPSTRADGLAKPGAILADSALVVPDREAKVQRRKGGTTHSACTRCERVTESVSIQKG